MHLISLVITGKGKGGIFGSLFTCGKRKENKQNAQENHGYSLKKNVETIVFHQFSNPLKNAII